MKNILLLAGVICSLASSVVFATEQDKQQYKEQICNHKEEQRLLLQENEKAQLIDQNCDFMPGDDQKIVMTGIIEPNNNPSNGSLDATYVWRVVVLEKEHKEPIARFEKIISSRDDLRGSNLSIDGVTSSGAYVDQRIYPLADNKSGFAMILDITSDTSCDDSGSGEYLTLFENTIKEGKLQPLLTFLPLSYWNVLDGTPCNPLELPITVEKTECSLKTLPNTTNQLHDLQLNCLNTINDDGGAYGSSSEVEKEYQDHKILKFDGTAYQAEKWQESPSTEAAK